MYLHYVSLSYKHFLKPLEINALDDELKELEHKQMATENVQDRLKEINKILDIEELTPEMLTKDLADAFFYKVIAVSKREAVFCIDATNSLTLQEFIDKRKELTFNKPIIQGIVNCQGTQRNDILNYKVITF